MRAHPRRRSARRARNGPRTCAPRNAAKAGTSTANPTSSPTRATDDQQWWIENRAEVQAQRDQAAAAGEDTEDLEELLAELDEEINRAGMRGKVTPDRGKRRHRSTRRRQDAPPLPRRKVDPRTVGKTYTDAGRQDVPPVAVPHPHLPVLRQA